MSAATLFLYSSGIRGWNAQRILKYDKLSFFIKLLCVGLCITAYPVGQFLIWLGQRIKGPYHLTPRLAVFLVPQEIDPLKKTARYIDGSFFGFFQNFRK